MMDYRIIRAIPEIGQIEVMYTHEGNDIASYAIDVPIVNGSYITGEELDKEIKFRAPVWLIERKLEVQNAVGFEQIQVPEVVSNNSVESINNTAAITVSDIEKQRMKDLIKEVLKELDVIRE